MTAGRIDWNSRNTLQCDIRETNFFEVGERSGCPGPARKLASAAKPP
jgi:hypothetical protein